MYLYQKFGHGVWRKGPKGINLICNWSPCAAKSHNHEMVIKCPKCIIIEITYQSFYLMLESKQSIFTNSHYLLLRLWQDPQITLCKMFDLEI